MVRTYRSHRRSSHRKTSRRPILRGGSIESVEDLLRNTPIPEIRILNPTSKFVVATYWWGEQNLNRNLQSPCPEDIMTKVRVAVVRWYGPRNNFPVHLVKAMNEFKRVRIARPLTPAEVDISNRIEKEWNVWVASLMTNPAHKDFIKTTTDEITAEETARTGKPARPFPDMIREWNEYCERAGVNHIALHTEFPRSDYQNAINGKPLFIKRILDAVKGKGPNGSDLAVLYIDGDMWMLKYPHLFDLDGVDFMARGWNMDSRSKEKSLKFPAYDPYVFETSGGTMYFGNTQAARAVLDKWAAASAKQPGKADDRILSQVFTMDKMILGTNLVNLPIEYLWLTDFYSDHLSSPEDPASIEDAVIEHHYCLTGEERATDQGAAANREPKGYEEQISEVIDFSREPELLYEYIFFDEDPKKREGFARYLKYMNEAKNYQTGEPMMTLINFNDKYGAFNSIVERNLASVASPAGPGRGAVTRGLAVVKGGALPTPLPLTASIPEILKALDAGTDVHLGEVMNPGPEDECVAVDVATDEDKINTYAHKLRIDTTKPMFFSAKSRTLRHLLLMCATLSDINTHINGSYMFMSRIRWKLLTPS